MNETTTQGSIGRMNASHHLGQWIKVASLGAMIASAASSCKMLDKLSAGAKDEGTEGTGDVDVDFLLSMTYEEACAITASKGEVPGVAKIAADSVEIVKVGKNGEVKGMRARGHVFLRMDSHGDPATALSQEAYVTDREVILRGRPILKRGGALLEGLTDLSVFYAFDDQVRAIGRHRVRSGLSTERPPEESAAIIANIRKNVKPSKESSTPGEKSEPPKLPDVGPWRAGPNPLLPPLDDTAVPEDIRAQMRKQAEAEAVLQNSKTKPGDLPTEPLNLPAPVADPKLESQPPAAENPPKEPEKKPEPTLPAPAPPLPPPTPKEEAPKQ